MSYYDVIIVGAGATGMMAAYEISKAGKKVLILEADHRIGGRIFTVYDNNFSQPTEAGAEFVHGDLPVTKQLLNASKIKYDVCGGRMISVYNRGDGGSFMSGWDVLEGKLLEVKEDMSVEDFLNKYFKGDKYKGLKNSIRGYAEGYDTADISIASVIAFRDEWLSDENQEQYRIEGGYEKLISYLLDESKKHDVVLHLSSIVKEVKWSEGKAEIKIDNGDSFTADKVIITVPIGVLLSKADAKAAIRFTPTIPDYINAAKKIGYGSVIKILFEFDEAFWYNKDTERRMGIEMDKMSFLFSGEEVPTWWTQYPTKNNLLTGWMGGSRAEKIKEANEKTIYDKAIQSLANIFKLSISELEKKLRTSKIINWTVEPFTLGSYSYATLDTEAARNILTQPIENVLYFAGEALYDGPEMGTVEAALASGLRVAQGILKG